MNSTDYIDDNNVSSDCSSSSSSPSPSQLALVNALTLWLEGHVTTAVGLVGLVANCVAVPVLRSPNLPSVFNHLLVALAVFDNVFVACCVLEAARKFYEDPYSPVQSAHQLVFMHFLYQLQNWALTCSIYITLAIAIER